MTIFSSLLLLPGNRGAVAEPTVKVPVSSSTEVSSSNKGLRSMGFFNIAISTPDINASVDWYQRVLGFRKVSQSNLSNGVSIAMIERNGMVIEFLKVPNQKPMPMLNQDPPKHLQFLGIKNFVLWVDDMDATVRELKSKNVSFVWEARTLPEVGTRVSMIRDNNGNLVTFWERRGSVWQSLNRP
ncbi:hypothetical protein DSM106972_073200 [Dulcicalothrix desertica PCC 7102]|uniref:VOC domain-containing protein n=2 Tax=Dulcicalothrix desertica TaxID=32056 RepID=A0A3S1AWY7_9CYAN|nr:hypothetical protein DSM106972_073200 [Dulcicalothrix desertica PCC 7102]